MQRRMFLKKVVYGGTALSLFPYLSWSQDHPQAVWVENGEPELLLSTALKAFGGLQRFIKSGDRVVIKPNMGWDRPPELAANTNPYLIAALVKACKQVGAKEVKVFDRTCNNPQRCYRNSRIQELAEEAGAEVVQVRSSRFEDVAINGKYIKSWPIYRDYLEADKVIDVPVAKHHSLSRVSLGMKNLMGVMGGRRGEIHNHFPEKLCDITAKLIPTLTLIDAYRVLMRNGPVGGNPADVKLAKTLILSDCMVSADYLALELFGLKLEQVEHIKTAYQRGLAKYNPSQLQVKRIRLS